MTPAQLAASIRTAIADDYPASLAGEARAWIDAMYHAHGDLYGSRLEHDFTKEFLRRIGLGQAEIDHALGALHP
jgi:hypothetical protein